jgi:hypothetical protein
MACRTTKSVIYHIPKCGGVWVKEVVRKSVHEKRYDRCQELDAPGEILGYLRKEHATPQVLAPSQKEGLFSIVFVRKPLEWHKSYWGYRHGLQHWGRKPFPPDKSWSKNFEDYALSILAAYPDGWCTHLYQQYVGVQADQIDYIGTTENLRWDLYEALLLAGEVFDDHLIRNWGNKNVTKRKYYDNYSCSKELEQRLVDADKWVLETFYG